LEVLRESVIDYTVPHRIVNFDPSLEKWEEQGVLLLNSALSCEVGKIGSHTLLWRPFITSFLTNLSKCSTGIVYVLMGSQAQSLEPYINKHFNYVIRCRHPSYYARTKTKMPKDIWQSINELLISQNGYGIEWYQEN
jgi:uracil-DNA glycosylase